MTPKIHIYTGLPRKFYYDPLLRSRHVISQRHPSFLTHIKQLAAIILALGLFWLAFALPTYHAPRPSYPYYNTEKPVPPWSEPTPLEGNRDR